MDWLASLPGWVLLGGWLAVALLTAAVGRSVVRAIVPEDERGDILGVVAPLMPALGATFAVLTAITLSSEAGYLKSAQDLVSAEAASASRLAWSATSPGVDSAPIQDALLDYLQVTVADEWDGDRAARGDDAADDGGDRHAGAGRADRGGPDRARHAGQHGAAGLGRRHHDGSPGPDRRRRPATCRRCTSSRSWPAGSP